MNARLFFQVFSVEARKLMSYRADFWITAIVGFIVQFGIVYFLWAAIMPEPGATIEGYSFDGMVLYYVLVLLLGRVVRGADHVAPVAQEIYEGALTRYLVFPVSYFRIKYAQHLGQLVPSSVQLLIFGLTFLVVMRVPEDVAFSPTSVAMAVVSVAVANMLYFTIAVTLQAVAFWADNVWSLTVMFRFVAHLLGGVMLPLALFPEWAQSTLAFLPFRYLFDFPVNTLIGRIDPQEWFLGLGVSLVWWIIAVGIQALVWRRGMLAYTGVGI